MERKIGNSLVETRKKNRILIKKQIYHQANPTRTQIAENLGLTLATLSTSTNEMISQGIIEETVSDQSVTCTGAGRRPKILRFCPACACAAGIDIGPYKTRAVLMDMGGNIIDSLEDEAVQNDYGRMIDMIETLAKKLMPKVTGNFLGVSVNVAGIVDSSNGTILKGIELKNTGEVGSPRKNLQTLLEEKLGCPVLIQNNAKSRALGHAIQNHIKDTIFAYLYVSRGIACPVMEPNEIPYGYSASIGELGRMVMEWNSPDGKHLMTLNEVAGEHTIIRRCRAAMESGGLKNLKRLCDSGKELSIDLIMELDTEGDAEIRQLFESSCEYLGIALSNISCMINPGMIVIDGYMFSNLRNRETLKNVYKEKCEAVDCSSASLFFIDYDSFAGARSAAYCALDKLFLSVE